MTFIYKYNPLVYVCIVTVVFRYASTGAILVNDGVQLH
jgi:hypothetical protein